MERIHYVHEYQDQAFECYKSGIAFKESMEQVYNEIEYKMKKPDFLGKTVKVSEKQFPRV